MRKNGFTLIELLAVIVILAIIALIATPIVLDIINDSKDSSLLRSAQFYLDGAELSIADRVMNHGGISDGTYNILENGNICLEEYDTNTKTCKDNDTKLDNNELKVEVDGEVFGEYELNENQEVLINETNILMIENGEANMYEANCPDQICVKHVPISKNGETIVCLPNKVVVTIKEAASSELDAVVN